MIPTKTALKAEQEHDLRRSDSTYIRTTAVSTVLYHHSAAWGEDQSILVGSSPIKPNGLLNEQHALGKRTSVMIFVFLRMLFLVLTCFFARDGLILLLLSKPCAFLCSGLPLAVGCLSFTCLSDYGLFARLSYHSSFTAASLTLWQHKSVYIVICRRERLEGGRSRLKSGDWLLARLSGFTFEMQRDASTLLRRPTHHTSIRCSQWLIPTPTARPSSTATST